MSGRTLLGRPRTRIYDANYNIGQNYYRPALDRLDRKYSPRPPSPLRSSIAQDILSRHEEAFADEDLGTARRRAEKHITESNLFDSRGGRIAQRALNLIENDVNEETASALQRIRASKSKKVTIGETSDFESAVNNINSQRLLERSDKVLRSVGLDENSRRALDEDISIKRRTLKVTYDGDTNDLVKWSPLQRLEEKESVASSAAAIRAKQSRDRLLDLEEEMSALAEKQVARERRAARFKAIVAESAEETEAAQTAIKAVSLRSRREQRILDE